MNYQRIYDEFIADRLKKEEEIEGYFEIHHILPRCLGGGDSKKNLIKLTPGDHLFAHQLLARIHHKTENAFKLWGAVLVMTRAALGNYRAGSAASRGIRKSKLRHMFSAARVKASESEAGDNHPASDPIKYRFVNEDGREYTGTRWGFMREYGLSSITISGLARGRTKKTKDGWSVPDMQNKESDTYKQSKKWREENSTKRYTFRTFNGDVFQGTLKSFCANKNVEMEDAKKITHERQMVGDWFIM